MIIIFLILALFCFVGSIKADNLPDKLFRCLEGYICLFIVIILLNH